MNYGVRDLAASHIGDVTTLTPAVSLRGSPKASAGDKNGFWPLIAAQYRE